MKIIICGAGIVGETLAISLAGGGNQVVVIDSQLQVTDRLARMVDVRTIFGEASDPQKLFLAGAAEADILIAVTKSDEVNLICCQMAYTLFQVPKRIARLKGVRYSDPRWQRFLQEAYMPNVVISPIRSIAETIIRRLDVPESSDAFDMVDNQITVLGFYCRKDTPLIGERLSTISRYFPDMDAHIFAVRRARLASVATGRTILQPGDEVYLACPKDRVSRVRVAFGERKVANSKKRFLLVGNNETAYNIAKIITDTMTDSKMSMIIPEEADPFDPAFFSDRIRLYRGNPADPAVLKEADINHVEALISLLPQTEFNFLVSHEAKQIVRNIRFLSLVSNMAYGPILSNFGVDSGVDIQSVTLSSVLSHVRKGRIRAIHPIFDQFGFLVEGVVPENSFFVDQSLEEIRRISDHVRVVMIIRNGETILPNLTTVIHANDICLLFAKQNRILQIEKMFSVQI